MATYYDEYGARYIASPDFAPIPGGQAIVWRCRRAPLQADGPSYAIKVFNDRDTAEREVALLSQLNREPTLRDKIVPLISTGTIGSQRFLVMPWYCATLRQWAEGPPLKERLRVLVEISRTVMALHRLNIVHRDIKPENIFIGDPGQLSPEIRIADFGTAVPDRADASLHGTHTPGYAPAAQILHRHGPPDPWWDVYALAVITAELLTGRPVQELHRMTATLGSDLRRLTGAPGARYLRDALSAALGVAGTPPDAGGFADDLQRVLDAIQAGDHRLPPHPVTVERAAFAVMGLICAGTAAAVADPFRLPIQVEAPAWAEVSVEVDGASAAATGRGWSARALPGAHVVKISSHAVGEPDRCASSAEITVHTFGIPWPERLLIPDAGCPASEYAMIDVAAGRYRIGPLDSGAPPDESVADVDIAAFRIGRTEVSQRLYTEITRADPLSEAIYLPDGSACRDYLGGTLQGADLPVICVSWCSAVRFADALSAAEGLPPFYRQTQQCESGSVEESQPGEPGFYSYRLPTEAEWEVAARAGDQHRRYSGDPEQRYGPIPCDRLLSYANLTDVSFAEAFAGRFRAEGWSLPPLPLQDCGSPRPPHGDGYATLAPVGAMQPNALGILQMSGNVREWTAGVYEGEPSVDCRRDFAQQENRAPLRAFRGSAFDDGWGQVSLSNRGHCSVNVPLKYVGIRLARTARSDLPAVGKL